MSEMPPPAASLPKSSGLAICSLVLGILGIILCLGPIAGIPAIVCGHIAHGRVRKSGGALSGGGMAIAGFVLGYISFAWAFVIGMMAAIAVPNFVKAREIALRNACINNLRQIDGATEQWALENKKNVGTPVTVADINSYLKGGFPVCIKGGKYTIGPVGTLPTCTEPGHTIQKP